MKKVSLLLVAAMIAPTIASAQMAARDAASYPRCITAVMDHCA